jgi:hypothetical protein
MPTLRQSKHVRGWSQRFCAYHMHVSWFVVMVLRLLTSTTPAELLEPLVLPPALILLLLLALLAAMSPPSSALRNGQQWRRAWTESVVGGVST